VIDETFPAASAARTIAARRGPRFLRPPFLKEEFKYVCRW
jgi:hypothetical protein